MLESSRRFRPLSPGNCELRKTNAGMCVTDGNVYCCAMNDPTALRNAPGNVFDMQERLEYQFTPAWVSRASCRFTLQPLFVESSA